MNIEYVIENFQDKLLKLVLMAMFVKNGKNK